jgi:hypothetical protein
LPEGSRNFKASLSLLLNGAGLLICLGSAFGFIGIALFSTAVNLQIRQEIYPLISLAWTAMLICVLLVPSTVNSIKILFGNPYLIHPKINSRKMVLPMVILWGSLLPLGDWIASQLALSALVLPPLQILAVGLPILWILTLALRGLRAHPPFRFWGIISIGLLVTPLVIMVIEILMALVGIILISLFVMTRPVLTEYLQNLLAKLTYAAQFDPESIQTLIFPLLQQPAVIFSGLILVAILIPLAEEIIKPIALWLSGGIRMSPEEGFTGGALCGAAFALLESLGMLSTPVSEGWAIIVIGRAGTGILHITCSAVVGWGFVSAWTNGKKIWFLYGLGTAVVLHALWNTVSLLTGFAAILPEQANGSLKLLVWIGNYGPPGLIILSLTTLFILFQFNIQLRRSSQQSLEKPYSVIQDPNKTAL